jgi:tetratricopeptide (TPR) repeat protein
MDFTRRVTDAHAIPHEAPIRDVGVASPVRLLNRDSVPSSAQHFSLKLYWILVFIVGIFPAHAQSGADPRAPSPTHPQLREPTGADRCLFCHAAEVQGYSRSAMAHALRRAGQEPDGIVSGNGTKITIHSSATGYWQSWENRGDKSTYRVDFVIGSGEHANGYLVDIGGHLFQSPVAFYKSRQAYDLAPGYENQPDPDFTRPVSEECVLCHSGFALHVPGTLNQYRPPVFAAEAITCERCHGPSEKHLADPRAGTIVNPSKLAPAARDSICEQCHLFGVARVPNPGKKLSDFVPGEALENTYTIYRNASPEGSSGDFKVISHVEQLALSSCARNSGGRLWCGTCHNAHEKMPQSVEYYRSRCLSCHTTSFPNAHPSRDSDCLGCHMPRRDAKDGGHTAFTDHKIQKRPEVQREVPANADILAWREPATDLRQRNLGIAYVDVGMQRHSSTFIIQGYRTLTGVQGQFRGDADFFKWIGEALLLAKQTADAKLALERALELDPDSALTETSAASPYIQEGDDARAIAHLERAVGIDPLFLPAASTLIGLYEKQGEAAKAAGLSAKITAAMTEASDGDQTAPTKSTTQGMKNIEDVFKNIRVLKGIPSDQLIPAMQFMSSSLGVQCSFCHVEGHFEKDDKKPKQTARVMMQMMFDVNKNSFEGRREVTCNSCHRGSRNPVSTPLVAGGAQASPHSTDSAGENVPTSLPTYGRLINNYIRALGGAAAIERVTSRIETGVTNVSGKSLRVEVFAQDPGKWKLVRHFPEDDSVSAFDGQAGWVRISGRPAREMHGSDIEAALISSDLHFPLHIQRLFPDLRVEYPEKIGERETYVLSCLREGRTAAKLHFDEESGLLVRVTIFDESPLGVNPMQIEYGDYREVEGVKVPYLLTFTEPGSSYSIQIEEVRQNVPIEAGQFARPSLSGPSDSSTAPK